MSIEVEPEALAETVEGMGAGYLLTLGDRPRPHVGAVATAVVDGVVRVHGVGRTGAAGGRLTPAVRLRGTGALSAW